MNYSSEFQESVIKLFNYYKKLGDDCFSQITDAEKLFWSPNENSNSIAVIVQHLHGNMMSRWTDFLSSDGEKDWRNRDQEFELYIEDKNELLLIWEEGWHCLLSAINRIDENNFTSLVYIRNQGHTITEAIHRQLAHYAYHVGQIISLAKIVEEDWSSLSIPKGSSSNYNEEKFSNPKTKGHFTDEFPDN